MLSRCLDSLEGVDSIVIVDTGSEDNTIEIAKKYTDKIYHFEWCDSFAKARNFAKSKATGEWILSIDADEQLLDPTSKVRKIIADTDKEVLGVTLLGGTGKKHQFPRLFKNKKDIYWKGDIHNYLSRLTEEDVDITIEYGYSPAHKKDPDRALRIAKKALKENPNLRRERYYLAREYFYRKRWKECIKEIDNYLKVANWLPEKNDANLMKARCLSKLGKYNEACDSAWEAVKYNANFKEALYFIGDHMDAGNKKVWHRFSEIANNDGVLFIRDRDEMPMDMAQEHIDYFKDLLKSRKTASVLEWGSGYSTKYFPEFMQKKGVEYTWKSMEHNKEWYEKVKSWNIKDVELVLADKDSKKYLEPSGKYDIVFIDGRNRKQCLDNAKGLLKKNGIVILHDAQRERYHGGMEGYKGKYIGSSIPKLWVGSRDIIK